MDLASSRRSTADERACVMCGQPARVENSLCSRDCLLEARRELDDNMAAIHQQGSEADGHTSLVERNGQLTSALISWSP